MEEEQGKGGEHRREEDLDAQIPPSSSLQLQPEIPLPIDNDEFGGDQVEEILTGKLGWW